MFPILLSCYSNDFQSVLAGAIFKREIESLNVAMPPYHPLRGIALAKTCEKSLLVRFEIYLKFFTVVSREQQFSNGGLLFTHPVDVMLGNRHNRIS